MKWISSMKMIMMKWNVKINLTSALQSFPSYPELYYLQLTRYNAIAVCYEHLKGAIMWNHEGDWLSACCGSINKSAVPQRIVGDKGSFFSIMESNFTSFYVSNSTYYPRDCVHHKRSGKIRTEIRFFTILIFHLYELYHVQNNSNEPLYFRP